MNSITMMANIVGFIVVVFVAVAFITLAIFYFNAQKKLLRNGLEDEALLKEVRSEISKLGDRFTSVSDAEAYFKKRKKIAAVVRRVIWGILVVIYIAAIGLIIISNTASGNRHIWLGDTAMMTIQTDSMASADPLNTYLFDENGIAKGSDRILQYSFITVSRKAKYVNSVRPGDILAFTMKAEDGKTDITVVHRLIGIDYDQDGNPLYTFRGDANPRSMAGEYQVSADRIVGVFESADHKGAENLFFGCFVTYLRSSTGITMTVLALMLMLIYMVLSDLTDKVYEEKYAELKKAELEALLPETECEIIETDSKVPETESIATDEESETGGDGL